MHLTTFTDYSLRVLIFLTLKYRTGEKATIPEMAEAYGISRNHLMKIVHELGLRGVIETVRGRTGGTTLARPPESISIGEIVRYAEQDFAVVECHEVGREGRCAVWQACNLKHGFSRAVTAFMAELDKMTLADAVSSTHEASSLLGLTLARGSAITVVPAAKAAKAPAPRAPAPARSAPAARRRPVLP